MNELAEYSIIRADIYKMLAAPFYTEMSLNRYEQLKKYLPVFESIALEFESADMEGGVFLLRKFFEENSNLEETAKQHRRFFARLFLGISRFDDIKNLCPQESFYLSSKHLVMQEERDSVLELYCREGIGKAENFKEPEDHISAEFHFMAHLCGKDESLAVQREFLNEHLLKWTPLLCADLYLHAGKLPDENGVREFYRGVAKLTDGFIKCERDFIECLTSV